MKPFYFSVLLGRNYYTVIVAINHFMQIGSVKQPLLIFPAILRQNIFLIFQTFSRLCLTYTVEQLVNTKMTNFIKSIIERRRIENLE